MKASLALSRIVRAASALLALAVACPVASAAPPAVSIRRVAPDGTTPRVYQRMDFAVTVTGGASPYANPFDPDEVAVDAIFRGPGVQRLVVPAFWSAPFERRQQPGGPLDMTPVPGGKAGWRVRFVPTAPGAWTVIVRAKDRSGTADSKPLSFRAARAAAGRHGFVRRATGAGRARYFERSDGTPYFMVGENVGWSSGDRGLLDYEAWFPSLGAGGANFARLWLAFRPIETKDTGLGRYDLRNAAYWDEVLALAEKNGLACMLALGTYGEFNTGGYFNEGTWPDNPYNAARGGPVPQADPDAFFTNAQAKKNYRQRLRYLIGRYSAFTGLGFWEFWNEKGGDAGWFREMASYLKQVDPYRHPVTNSYTTTGPTEVWNIPEIDLTQTHRYGDEGSIHDVAPGLPTDTRDHDVYRKPHLMGEFGISWRGPDAKFDEKGTATNLHNGLWAAALSGHAGGAMIWWWDNYIHPKNLYHVFTPLARFAARVDWPRRAFEPLEVPIPTIAQTGTETFRDLTLSPGSGWGQISAGPVVVRPDGTTSGSGSLLGNLYGPAKPELRSVQAFEITMPADGALKLRIGTVSDRAEIRVRVDGNPAATFPFDARPDGPGGYKETTQHPEWGGIYQASFDVSREVPLPAGRRVIEIENAAGDWVSVLSYTFTGAVSGHYSTLRPVAIQDRATGETLLWLQDAESNWYNDREGMAPARWEGVVLSLPVPRPGAYRVEWWDTRKGQAVQAQTLTARGKSLSLKAPAFTRDIALRVTVVKKP